MRDRQELKLVVKKFFDEHVIEHLDLSTFFNRMGWGPVLHLSRDYYPYLVREFYANILYKHDKELIIVITTIKGVRIVLDRVRLAEIYVFRMRVSWFLLIPNFKTIKEDHDWSYEAKPDHLQICPCPGGRIAILHGDDFLDLLPLGPFSFLWLYFSTK